MLQIIRVDIVDGQSVFWQDGPRLGLEEILNWLSIQKTMNEEED